MVDWNITIFIEYKTSCHRFATNLFYTYYSVGGKFVVNLEYRFEGKMIK